MSIINFCSNQYIAFRDYTHLNSNLFVSMVPENWQSIKLSQKKLLTLELHLRPDRDLNSRPLEPSLLAVSRHPVFFFLSFIYQLSVITSITLNSTITVYVSTLHSIIFLKNKNNCTPSVSFIKVDFSSKTFLKTFFCCLVLYTCNDSCNKYNVWVNICKTF